ncbi:zinc-finger domain-containing protein [Macrococcoides caseolyticum]|uniref:zinc-finger domain-containing protein n=1 Tax=Macrococcoides caseolyticum TaxID=69966 RepID=UPI001F19C2D2|nr:zinc-finger domain-containing protein [Macrococcus caseolyticus]MCE4957029.1 zinc-finger domain-containing protein [Macrococcus caseolyticus]
MNLEQKITIKQIDTLTDYYCSDCLLKRYHRKIQNKNYAHHYCIKKCSVGIEIKRLGNILQ